MMLADSSESAVRAAKPQSRNQIMQIVRKIIDDKRAQGQLDESGLTLNDLEKIERTFVDVLQGVFHPRVNYQEAARKQPAPAPMPAADPAPSSDPLPAPPAKTPDAAPDTSAMPSAKTDAAEVPPVKKAPAKTPPSTPVVVDEAPAVEQEEEPMSEVPRLPPIQQRKTTTSTYPTVTDDNQTDDEAVETDRKDR
jgi:hypothetical protein